MDERDLEPVIFEYAEIDGVRLTGVLCLCCQARGIRSSQSGGGLWRLTDCEECGGAGCHGIKPELPTISPPGSMERVFVMAARYAAGLPIFNPSDERIPRSGNWRIIKESKERCRFVPLSNPEPPMDPEALSDDYDDLCD